MVVVRPTVRVNQPWISLATATSRTRSQPPIHSPPQSMLSMMFLHEVETEIVIGMYS